MRNILCVAVLLLAAACGGRPQSTECKKFLECEKAILPAGSSLDPAYGPDGKCWNDTADAAAGCTAFCKSNLEINAAGNPDVAACQ